MSSMALTREVRAVLAIAMLVAIAPTAAGIGLDASASLSGARADVSVPAPAPAHVGVAASPGVSPSAHVTASVAPAPAAAPVVASAPASTPTPLQGPAAPVTPTSGGEGGDTPGSASQGVADEVVRDAVAAADGVTRFVDPQPAGMSLIVWLKTALVHSIATVRDAVVTAAPAGVPDARADDPALAPASHAAAPPAPAAEPGSVPPATAAVVLAATGALAGGWALMPRGAFTGALRRLLGLGGAVAGYSRIARAQLLDHDVRRTLHEAVTERAGITLGDLVTAAACGRSAVTHHLRVLEREGLITSRREGRHRLYFPAGVADGPRPADAPALAVLGHETTRAFADAVMASPGVDQSGLCARLGLAPSLAHWHARRLEAARIVRREREGRHVRYYPGPLAARFSGAAWMTQS